ncbi:MAG: hypothetical protein A2268_12440 [Candidatus Raymondbacteria bacterium RifOxyA12_full_50_37]|uniref:Smr domain-containing protein n=1 Tax=Candidatus Raymondbacteria bacterium RIFOXYD12_FULL_49_13 TaxID=1817890 RepID=A0A1F7F8F8_UNCRA|nr:MAG: hypothetical protein A2268_12440 [Candidatus Raymondbacteria bacterium RifOxyA12_full_50_37]OGJ91346.1 MAG: hypothetical protein A2248_03935 [Candidatus Raymondbacteria bacterium RIFOXYA2_FULL_49_16]OGJ91560.1 MAG: hypothetical protein A2350_11765 [Candidatus Raymondbacteria bacterium RifOxyB12_full_50_8]OGJ97749.1 MAG: hypothetical protein A2453_13785 [Candidatus Raymondbacteria bacterium RIFOXYC2_FULL_50_21]OGK00149.1 MAG: hypothetical protein A2487_09545 [Candidatus Raymondbacteria b
MKDPLQFQIDWVKRHPVSLMAKYDGKDPALFEKKKARHRKKVPKVSPPKKVREISVDEEIDLHGLTIDQGIVELELFLDMAREYKLTSVRVIHGLGPDKGDSLRKEVHRYFKTRGKKKISGFFVEPHNQGAVIVYP